MALRLTTTNPARTDGGMGVSNTARLEASFGSSPVGKIDALKDNGELDAPIRLLFQKLALDGIVPAGFGIINFNRDFVGPEGEEVPTYGDVETGAGGLPASPWVPNPASVGPDTDMNPTALPAPPEGFGLDPNSQFGSGVGGSERDPAVNSINIAKQQLGNYKLGKSVIE